MTTVNDFKVEIVEEYVGPNQLPNGSLVQYTAQVSLGGAVLVKADVTRIMCTGAPTRHDEAKEEVLYRLGLKLQKLLGDPDQSY